MVYVNFEPVPTPYSEVLVMASTAVSDFQADVSYALSCLKRSSLVLKSGQEAAIRDVYDGSDVFVWLPTGYGKSICYQVLPYLFDSKLGRVDASPVEQCVVLIISPLISLMVDQVTALQSQGVGAAILSGNAGVDKKLLATVTDIQAGKFKLLFSSPEAAVVGPSKWKDLMLTSPLSHQIVALVVDEAHCVYKW